MSSSNASHPSPDVSEFTPEQLAEFTNERTEELPHNCPPNPVVSVCMITYNHAKFIAQAIDSVLMQECDFPVEIVIGEDCSTDGTRDIVLEYHKRHPDRIRVLLSTENLGKYTGNGRFNFIRNLKVCRSKYIAMLDGDDYWTDPYKLQKQVDFLHSEPEYVLCFHNALVFYEDQSRSSFLFCPPNQQEISRLEDLLIRDFMPTCSVLFRRCSLHGLPDWIHMFTFGDWIIWIHLLKQGKAGYINQVMGAYRKHSGGAVADHLMIKNLKEILTFYDHVFENFDLPPEALAVTDRAYGRVHYSLGIYLMLDGQETEALNHMRNAIVCHEFLNYDLDFALKRLFSLSTWFKTIRRLRMLVDMLPNEYPGMKSFKNRLWGRYYRKRSFEAYEQGQLAIMRRCIPKAIWYDPKWCCQRSVLLMWAEAILGSGLTRFARKKVRLVRDRMHLRRTN